MCSLSGERYITVRPIDFRPNERTKLILGGKKNLGGLLFAGAFGLDVVVINDIKIAEDLLERRAKLYNDRPQIPVVGLYVFFFVSFFFFW